MDSFESSPVVRRFFKVIMPGFETRLKLPPAFMKTLNNMDMNSKRAVLNSCNGSWNVSIEKCEDGMLHFFGESWADYVSAHDLKMGEFIVFKHIGDLHFKTLVFDVTCCEKDFATSEENEEDDDDVVCLEEHVEHIAGREKAPYNVSNQIANPQFQITLPKWAFEKYLVNVPIVFARSNDMRQNKTVKLRNDTGDSWLVRLSVHYISSNERVILTSLNKFLSENKLKIGDTCIFELVQPSRNSQEHVVMDVVFMRKR